MVLGNLAGKDFGHKAGSRAAHRLGRFFLKKVRAIDFDDGLIWPCTAEFSLGADQESGGLGIDKKLWDWRSGEPLCIRVDHPHHILRFPSNREASRPGKHRLTRWTRNAVRSTISFHCLLRDVSQWKEVFNEQIFVQN